MELKEFIKQTLSQVVFAIKESQDELQDTGVIISPKYTRKTAYSYEMSDSHLANSQVHEIKFNVSLSVENNTGEKAGLNVLTGWLNAGGQLSSEQMKQNLNSVEFTIPVVFPSGNEQVRSESPGAFGLSGK